MCNHHLQDVMVQSCTDTHTTPVCTLMLDCRARSHWACQNRLWQDPSVCPASGGEADGSHLQAQVPWLHRAGPHQGACQAGGAGVCCHWPHPQNCLCIWRYCLLVCLFVSQSVSSANPLAPPSELPVYMEVLPACLSVCQSVCLQCQSPSPTLRTACVYGGTACLSVCLSVCPSPIH